MSKKATIVVDYREGEWRTLRRCHTQQYCRCADKYCPCEGVLAGGMCDDMQDDPDEYT